MAHPALSADGQITLLDPWTQSVAFQVKPAGRDVVEQAARSARKAFLDASQSSVHQRSQLLTAAAKMLEGGFDELVTMTISHIGKPRRAAEMEVRRSIAFMQACAQHAHNLGGEVIPLDAVPAGKGLFGFTRRVPYGVVAAITPFNAPSNLLVQKVAPAFVTGNAVLIKPSLEGTKIAQAIADAFVRAGVARELIQVLPGDREEALALASSPNVDLVTLTGGTAAGDALASAAGAKRFLGELGGNSANIVAADANLEDAVARLIPSSFEASGQQCISTQRIIVDSSISDQFISRFVEAAKKLKVGDPRLAETDLGPVVNARAATRISAMIDDARARGCKVISTGEPSGCVIPPTIVIDPSPDSRLVCEEVFGPVVVIIRADGIDHAIRIANESEFGLQASCFTGNLATAMRISAELRAGSVWINEASRFRLDNYPFGGMGRSGVGREGLPYALEEYTQPKFTGIRIP